MENKLLQSENSDSFELEDECPSFSDESEEQNHQSCPMSELEKDFFDLINGEFATQEKRSKKYSVYMKDRRPL